MDPYPDLPRTVGLLLATLVLAAILAVGTMVAFPNWPEMLRMALPTELALVAAIGWAVARTRLGWRRALLLGRLEPATLLPLGLVLIGAITVFGELYVVMQKLVPVPAAFEETLRELLRISGPVDFAVTVGVAVVVAPILEEALFRGVVLQGLARSRGPRAAVGWSAIFFSLFHLYNPWQILPTFFLGLVLAWVVMTTRTLLSGILVHGAFNAISLGIYAGSVGDAPGGISPQWFVAGLVAALVLGSLSLLVGMAWLERVTGGGWFEGEGGPLDSSGSPVAPPPG
ncbi:MAG: CPBP family intramembrane glutamic endopeptidase [Gemmatimonadota bacterium]|nr:CPBP family intramembrane glutamic endopeptidase [Gemmatimonadota bacterium]